ncbi:carbohydrate ABC transporter permease [Microlunatus soli]|uniref:Multiple sugar transport system permease protein n=1 Tax=Microlunatus soli TaxID=630515 RepID=A0A1H1QM18_9ACTN|nr:sugar ABC transporter permease [Microlunatus soli]SDS24498.1 multiple sugar transport system permease protein [Microlunatus soli]
MTSTLSQLAARGSVSPQRDGLGRRVWSARQTYLLILPGVVLTAMFSVYPLVMSWYYSALDWDGFSADKYFVGFANFAELARDPFFWRAFGRSILFTVVATPIELLLGLLIAMVLNDRSLRLRSVYRAVIFIPVVTTTAIVSIVMSFLFSAFNSPPNQVLMGLGIIDRPIDFLGDPRIVLWTAIGIFVWKWVGQPMIYWLAGLQTVPNELAEAAQVDGAGPFRRFRYITLPILKPFAIIITLIVTAGNLQVFAFFQTLTGGGPYFASELMELFIYRMAFGTSDAGATSIQRLGYASAAGVLFGLALMVFGISQALMLRKIRQGQR